MGKLARNAKIAAMRDKAERAAKLEARAARPAAHDE